MVALIEQSPQLVRVARQLSWRGLSAAWIFSAAYRHRYRSIPLSPETRRRRAMHLVDVTLREPSRQRELRFHQPAPSFRSPASAYLGPSLDVPHRAYDQSQIPALPKKAIPSRRTPPAARLSARLLLRC